MAEKITIELILPEKTFKKIECAKAIIPAFDGPIAVLPSRAPTNLQTKEGVVSILDNNDKETAKYFVSTGIADIANNYCKLIAEEITDAKNKQ